MTGASGNGGAVVPVPGAIMTGCGCTGALAATGAAALWSFLCLSGVLQPAVSAAIVTKIVALRIKLIK
ncbi:hypothetical protein JK183_02655 [Acetobacter thailandicus]|nr:hypothetical protein [Acetobacter thailandicus]